MKFYEFNDRPITQSSRPIHYDGSKEWEKYAMSFHSHVLTFNERLISFEYKPTSLLFSVAIAVHARKVRFGKGLKLAFTISGNLSQLIVEGRSFYERNIFVIAHLK